ncbi:MAG TPA: glycosyltransferase [Candidatus Nanoarchaeia archaeon]|nr:glycosyltransferase [Candidatus Nanoarchaeia archaeon]
MKNRFVSAIITAFKEPKTIGRAIKAIAMQKVADEIIISAPDKETLSVARKLSSKYKNIRLVKDEGLGKPAALNLAVSKARGDILILTDGDVYVSKDSLRFLMKKLKDRNIGAVSGKPVSLNSKTNKYGFWANMLTMVADEIRKESVANDKRFFCSGYLFAIRKKLFPKLPKNLLSEDGYISHKVYEKEFKIDYAENARVFVKYPDNFSDWIKQKKRSAGGYNQMKILIGTQMRSFGSESRGTFRFFKFVRNIQQLWWLLELLSARLYLWYAIYRDVNFKKKSHKELWLRVESTK